MSELLTDEVLRPWLLASLVRAARYGRDRQTANNTMDPTSYGDLLPPGKALVGGALLATTVSTYERLSKGLFGWNGRALSSLSEEEADLYLEGKRRIERHLRRFEAQNPGSLIFDVPCDQDEETRQKKWFVPESVRLTMKGLVAMEEELEKIGGKWLRLSQTNPNVAAAVADG